MAILHLVCRPSLVLAGFTATEGPLAWPADWQLSACGDRPPREAAAALARSGTAIAGNPPPWPSPAGLMAELTSRPGRLVETWLASPSAVAESGKPVGLATLVTASRGGQPRHSIGWLLVHPAARRRGLGRRLAVAVLQAAACRGCDAVWIETRSDWTASTAFWRACGFAEPGPEIRPSRLPA